MTLPLQSTASTALPSPVFAWRAWLPRVLRRLVQRSAALLSFFALWEIAPRLELVPPAFLPPFSEVLASAGVLLANGELAAHVSASLARSLTGFLLALVTAVPLGLAIGWSKTFSTAVSPLFELLRNTAALALLPVFILLLGIGESSKVALVVYSCAWPILLNTIGGVRSADPLLVKCARTMGISGFGLLQKVLLPAALPMIFVGVRLAGSYSLLVLVAAEMIGAKAGLGYLIIYSQYNFQIAYMYVGILTTTLIGVAFTQLLSALERSLVVHGRAPDEVRW